MSQFIIIFFKPTAWIFPGRNGGVCGAALYSTFSEQERPLLSVNYEIQRQRFVLHCKKPQGKALGKEILNQLPLTSGRFQKTPRERHGRYEPVSILLWKLIP